MNYRLQFISPCFCGGADQITAEIRPAAIRGELRWWFRCLGGSKAQEERVFGTMAGNGASSSVQVRVSNVQRSGSSYCPTFISPNDPEAYHHYLLTAPNDKGQSRMWKTPPDAPSKKKGVVREESQIPHGSTFDLAVTVTRAIPDPQDRTLFEVALDCLLLFGAIGYRKTRGFGAWMAPERLLARGEMEKRLKALEPHGFSWHLGGPNNDSLAVLRQIEGRLKGDRVRNTGLRLNHKAIDKTPLGYSRGPRDRQSSAVHFRPCAFKTKAGDIQYALLVFQAPDSVLGDAVLAAYKGRTRITLAP